MGLVNKTKLTNILVPVGSGALTYFIVKDNKKLNTGTKLAISGGAALGSFLLLAAIRNLSGNVEKAPVDYGQIPVLPGGVKWNPDPLAQEISKNLEGYNFVTYPETTDKIKALNDDQVRLLYNHYNQYYAKDYPTLTKLIENEWTDWGDSYETAIARLKGLGLNEGMLSFCY